MDKMNENDKNMQKIDFYRIEVGVRFKVFREIIDITQSQLAAELDVPQFEIVEIEEGRVFPNTLFLHYLYEEYGLNINWLMAKVGPMFNEKDPKNLGATYPVRPPVREGDPRFELYKELMELMEIPAIKRSIEAALLEIKTLLKKESRGVTDTTDETPD
ncbi:MAG: helix-turn-helix transcriptional regulator [Candidatus Aminicenantes bacterium]|nr:helix-turn-helix transcriptional regulator [Candidatus Aminicenantes bacterium]